MLECERSWDSPQSFHPEQKQRDWLTSHREEGTGHKVLTWYATEVRRRNGLLIGLHGVVVRFWVKRREFGKGSGSFEMTVAPGSPLVVSVGVGLQGDEC